MNEENKVAQKNTAAWMAEDGRVVPAASKETAERDGGASASALRVYSIPLVRASEAAQRIAELERQRDNLLRRQGETPDQMAARRRARIDAAQARGETPPRDPASGCGGYFDPLWLDADDDSPLPAVQAADCGECSGRGFVYWGEGSRGNGFDIPPEPPETEKCPVCEGSGKEPAEGCLFPPLLTRSPSAQAQKQQAVSEPFAHFVQPSGFGPFVEVESSHPHAFPAYRTPQAPRPASALTDAQINYMGEQWDGCIYDGIDIGAALRKDLKNLDALMAVTKGGAQ